MTNPDGGSGDDTPTTPSEPVESVFDKVMNTRLNQQGCEREAHPSKPVVDNTPSEK